ncbi:ABC transporter permease [Malacoplasma penetrans]|uniref:Sugar ABC transporter permease n=1 Tax=Malacoplasma penetrans (strain HF-2) TaxID=272633 RepID=Q8EVH6_MALP2|nr:ABC transporter permease [Malacoplasma penetrans]RXY96919.1 ABC transporter permease [Malacoplasma penetrans]BAC44378.1 sugar ABC transporter permease [Malacoplasma penetrans HF-2]
MKNFYNKNLTTFDKLFYQTKQKSLRRNFLSVTLCIVFALFVSFVIISALGTKPEAFFQIFVKAFAWEYDAQHFAVQLCTYIVAALAFSFSMRVGIFNIGISGQMMAGGSTAFLLISLFPQDFAPAGGQIITLLFSILGATAVAVTIGLLKIYFKVNEVVSAILLNWIILYIVGALIYKYDLDQTGLNNGLFRSNAMNPAFTFWQEGDFWGWAWSIGITVVCVVAIWVILKFTVFGHKLKTTGQSPFAAQNFGYNKNALQLWSFAISGILSGILAVIVYTGTYTRSLDLQSAGGLALNKTPTQGFDGIAIGLIALNNPLAIVVVSFIFTFPNVGAAPAGLPSSTIQLIVGIMMYIVAIYSLLNYFKPWREFIKNRYGKQNQENYMNLENSVFEVSEAYSFEYKRLKNEFINLKIENSIKKKNLDKFTTAFLSFFVKVYYSVVLPLSNKEFKARVLENKKAYAEKREKINNDFKFSCVISTLDYWKHFVFKKNNSIDSKWLKDKEKIKKWINECPTTMQEDFTILNLEEQYSIIEKRVAEFKGGNQ